MRTLIVMMCLCGCVVALAQAPAVPAPKIVCDEPVWDFGSQVNTQVLEHVFILRNEGDASLEISAVRPTCGCTVAQLSANSVPPGTEITLNARLDLRGRSGTQHKLIRVESNDPTQPTYTLTMTGTAVTEVAITPSQLFLGRLQAHSLVTGAVEIVSQLDVPLRLTGVETDSGCLAADIETVEEGRRYRLLVRTQEPLPIGHFFGRVNVRTDHPGAYANLAVTVNFLVPTSLTVAPTEIVLDGPAGQPVTRHIVLNSPENQPFELLGVDPPMPDVKVSTYPMGSAGYRVQLDDLVAGPELQGTFVRIRTSISDMPEVVVPIRVVPAAP